GAAASSCHADAGVCAACDGAGAGRRARLDVARRTTAACRAPDRCRDGRLLDPARRVPRARRRRELPPSHQRRCRCPLARGAAGGDLLFAEACLARGVPLSLLLPLAEREFVTASVLPVEDGLAWQARFRAVVARLDRAPREAPTELGALEDGEDPFVRGNLW